MNQIDLYSLVEGDLAGMEGLRLKVYDDATGAEILPGYTLKGHPTIGYGQALDTRGITIYAARFLLSESVIDTISACIASFPWFEKISTNRQRVIANMAFELGIDGLHGFKDFISYIESENWQAAAKEMLNSVWATKQAPGRAHSLSQLFLTG